ncbi:MAG: hypothetical protein J2P25_24300 [Nocardiopsaceae bacterium]|nr:hypothetical protein [Nocardiopsaceae bacterium]
MDASLRAVLNESERLLVADTDRAALADLDEDGAIELEARVRRTRDKYVSQYRRSASARVAEHGARGSARPENARAAAKAEAFERALSRVSRRVAALARQAAAAMRAERLAAARAAKDREWPGADEMVPRQRGQRRVGPPAPMVPTGEGAPRNPSTEKRRASTMAAGARRQAKRDSKNAAS